MKPCGARFLVVFSCAAVLSGCAALGGRFVSEVSGCVEAVDVPDGDHCIRAELHRFRAGVAFAPGSYVMADQQPLSDGLCFRFLAPTGASVAVKTRDSDRVLIGGSVYVVAGDASSNLVVRHQRHPHAAAGEGHRCERPLAGVE